MKLEPNHANNNDNSSAPDNIPQATTSTLGDQAQATIENYFAKLDGYPISNVYHLVMDAVEKPLLEATLKHCGSNQTKASEILGISRSTLRKKMGQYGLK